MNNYYNKYEHPYQNEYLMPAKEPYTLYNKPGVQHMHGMTSNLFSPYEGFIRGNMFPDLYSPYTDEEPYGTSPENDQEALLNKIRELIFVMIELDLYLDTHPNDSEKIKLYNQYSDYVSIAKEEYAKRFGPLSLSSEALKTYPWAWLKSPWPWEVK